MVVTLLSLFISFNSFAQTQKNQIRTPGYMTQVNYLSDHERFQQQIRQLPLRPTTDVSQLQLSWPLWDPRPKIFTLFASANVMIRKVAEHGENFATFHDGLDIIRSVPNLSDKVIAPEGGPAVVVEELPSDPYRSFILILSPSNVVIQILHVNVDPRLPRNQIFSVKRGDILGILASPTTFNGEPNNFRHVHLTLIDPVNWTYLNPLKFLREASTIYNRYLPVISKLELRKLRSGFDLILEAYSEDPAEKQNHDIYEFDYSITDKSGRVLRRASNCRPENWAIKVVQPMFYPAFYLDIPGLEKQADDQLVKFLKSDLTVPQRHPRYLLNQFENIRGTCQLNLNISPVRPARGASFKSGDTFSANVSIRTINGSERKQTFELRL